MSTREDLYQELADAGVQEDFIARLRQSDDASPLRQDNKRLTEENKSLRNRIAAENFKAAGVKVNPAALNLPSELDVTDIEKVKGWAMDMGFVEAPPPVPDEEIAEHDRTAAASAGGGSTGGGYITPAEVEGWSVQRWASFKAARPEDAEAILRGEEVRAVAGV